MSLDDIPLTSAPPQDARPSMIVAQIQQIKPSRRTVLKGLLVAAAAAALVPLDWFLTRREAAAAGPTSDFGDCAPTNYDAQRCNWWKEESPGPLCWGGWRRGSLPCEGGFHREGSFTSRGETYKSTREPTSCEGKNGWRWQGYRCSDAFTEATFEDGDTYRGITISACKLDGTEAAAPAYVAPPTTTTSSRGRQPTTSSAPADGAAPAEGAPPPARERGLGGLLGG